MFIGCLTIKSFVKGNARLPLLMLLDYAFFFLGLLSFKFPFLFFQIDPGSFNDKLADGPVPQSSNNSADFFRDGFGDSNLMYFTHVNHATLYGG